MSSRDLNECCPQIRDAAPLIIAEYNERAEEWFPQHGSVELITTCTSRPSKVQWKLYLRGRIFEDLGGNRVDDPQVEDWIARKIRVRSTSKAKKVTNLDGYHRHSKHNTGKVRELSDAIDFGVIVDGKYAGSYHDHYLYKPLGELAHKHGLIHGGTDYRGWKDMPHVEVQGPYRIQEDGSVTRG